MDHGSIMSTCCGVSPPSKGPAWWRLTLGKNMASFDIDCLDINAPAVRLSAQYGWHIRAIFTSTSGPAEDQRCRWEYEAEQRERQSDRRTTGGLAFSVETASSDLQHVRTYWHIVGPSKPLSAEAAQQSGKSLSCWEHIVWRLIRFLLFQLQQNYSSFQSWGEREPWSGSGVQIMRSSSQLTPCSSKPLFWARCLFP